MKNTKIIYDSSERAIFLLRKWKGGLKDESILKEKWLTFHDHKWLTFSRPLTPVNKAISTRADKWLNFSHYSSTKECLWNLKAKGFKIAATHLKKDAVSYTSLDYTQPIAIILGNESQGISEEACRQADYIIKIPMFGMAQSLNLSVSAGIILYEAVKQRLEKGYYGKIRLSPEEFVYFKDRFLTPDIKKEGGI